MLSIFVREIHFIEEFTDYTKTNQTRYSWTVISASRQYTERLLSDGKSQIFCWR